MVGEERKGWGGREQNRKRIKERYRESKWKIRRTKEKMYILKT